MAIRFNEGVVGVTPLALNATLSVFATAIDQNAKVLGATKAVVCVVPLVL
jgi:hypothetical protein